MASDPSIKDQLFSKVKSRLSHSLPFRQGSTSTLGDGSSSSAKQTLAFRPFARSSTSNLLLGSIDSKTDHGAGHTPSTGDPSLLTQSRTINIVLFGETGVGKSSVINLIARREVAKVSSDVNGCTMQSTRHNISFDGTDYAIFDTIGLEEPQMGVNGYLKAIERAYELIMRLSAAGGIHLLLFCMRGGRITATTQSNYRLFCECLCNTKVPIALVFTGLEREVEMEDWWTRNKNHIEHYGIKSSDHACITAVQDDTPGEDLKYAESQKRIRELLKSCALKSEAFLPETYSWFARLGKGMRSFIEKHKNPKRRNVMWVLTHRCKLDPETARKIVDMMEKGDTEPKDGNPGEQPGNKEAESGSGSASGKDEKEGVKSKAEAEPGGTDGQEGVTHEVANNRPLAPQKDLEASPCTDRREKRRVVDDETPKDRPLGNTQSIVEAGPRPARSEKDKTGLTDERAAKNSQFGNPQNIAGVDPHPVWPAGNPVKRPPLDSSQNTVEAGLHTEQTDQGGIADEKPVKGNPLGNPQNINPRPVEPERKDKTEVTDEKAAKDYPSGNPQNIANTKPRPVMSEGKDRLEATDENAARSHPMGSPRNNIDAPLHPIRLESEDENRFTNQLAVRGRTLVNEVAPEARTIEPDEAGVTIEKATNGHTSATPQHVVDAGPHTAKPEKSSVANEKTGGHPLGKPQNGVDAEHCSGRPEGKDNRGVTNERIPISAVAQKDVDVEHRTGRPEEKGGRQSGILGASAGGDSQVRSRRANTQPSLPLTSVAPFGSSGQSTLTMPGGFPGSA